MNYIAGVKYMESGGLILLVLEQELSFKDVPSFGFFDMVV